jgi:hypothetical protein
MGRTLQNYRREKHTLEELDDVREKLSAYSDSRQFLKY